MTAEPPVRSRPPRRWWRGVHPRSTAPRGCSLQAAVHPAVLVLAVAGAVAIASDTRPVGGAALVAVALLLAWDGVRAPAPAAAPSGPPAPSRLGMVAGMAAARARRAVGAPTGVVAVLGLLLALVAGGSERFSWPPTVVVWAFAVFAVVVGWAPPPTEPTPPSRGRARAWAAVAIIGALWELAALLGQPDLRTGSWEHPTVSVLLDPVLATSPGRAVLFALWLTAGWQLCQRATR